MGATITWPRRIAPVIPYFLIWAWIAFSALFGRQRWGIPTSLCVWLVFTLLIGLRVEIGVDWGNYLPKLHEQIGAPLDYPLSMSEPGYALANWISARMGWGIFGVNTICSILFSSGLVLYCRSMPYPWLALILAYPYLAIVVAMNYSRQGVAIGLELIALFALERNRLLQFLGWIALASTFHASALTMLVLPLGTISNNVRRPIGFLRLLLFAGTGYGLYNAILSGSVVNYQVGYLEAKYQSQGAIIRIVLCLLPALIFLWKRLEFPISPQQRSIYTLMSWISVAAAIALVVSPSSTAVDRIALYLLPLQIFVGSYLPLIHLLGFPNLLWRQLLVLFTLAVLSVWLFFAVNAFAWFPYRNLLFEF